MRQNLEHLLSIARKAARAAAEVHYRMMTGSFEVTTKGSPMDLVTAVDREAERALVSVIRAARPDDSIIGEEGTALAGASNVSWILDPVDGTTNFVYGLPAHAVAVGVEIDGRRALGVVCDTYHRRTYSGLAGQGAECDGRPLRVRESPDLARALIGTGFTPDAAARRAQGRALAHLLPLVRDVRRMGCPALDLCAVATGALDAYYEVGLKRWDIAAGAAIAEAAGAVVKELPSPIPPGRVLVAAGPGLVESLIGVLIAAGAVAIDPLSLSDG